MLSNSIKKFMCFKVYDEMLQVSEITMPRILAEAVFSAQREEAMGFHKSSRFLVLLCVTSGIFR